MKLASCLLIKKKLRFLKIIYKGKAIFRVLSFTRKTTDWNRINERRAFWRTSAIFFPKPPKNRNGFDQGRPKGRKTDNFSFGSHKRLKRSDFLSGSHGALVLGEASLRRLNGICPKRPSSSRFACMGSNAVACRASCVSGIHPARWRAPRCEHILRCPFDYLIISTCEMIR